MRKRANLAFQSNGSGVSTTDIMHIAGTPMQRILDEGQGLA